MQPLNCQNGGHCLVQLTPAPTPAGQATIALTCDYGEMPVWVPQGQTFAPFLPRSGFGAAVYDANNATGVGAVVVGGTSSFMLMSDVYDARFGEAGGVRGHTRGGGGGVGRAPMWGV